MYMTMSISSGLYPNLDLWNANKLQSLFSLSSTEFVNPPRNKIPEYTTDSELGCVQNSQDYCHGRCDLSSTVTRAVINMAIHINKNE